MLLSPDMTVRKARKLAQLVHLYQLPLVVQIISGWMPLVICEVKGHKGWGYMSWIVNKLYIKRCYPERLKWCGDNSSYCHRSISIPVFQRQLKTFLF